MNKVLVPYAVVPAAVLILLTVLRSWLEVNSPDSAKFVSVMVLALAWLLVMPSVMLGKGLSLVQGILVTVVFFVLHRAAVGAVYALAWSGQWTVAGTETPVRYVAQTRAQSPEASAMLVFLQNTFAPVLFAVVVLLIVWTITWAVAFRGKRGFAGAAA